MIKDQRRGGGMPPRPQIKPEFKEKILDLRRVTRVVKGGKRMSFRATVVLGDEHGRVGLGMGKGLDVAQAVDKAKLKAKKAMITVPMKGKTVLHEVYSKYSAAEVIIKPAKAGHGLKAGGAARNILLLAGVKDATAKVLSTSKNKLTTARATIEALKDVKATAKTAKPKEEVVKEVVVEE